MTPSIAPCLWLTDQALEAAEFYVSLFPDSAIDLVTHTPAELSALGWDSDVVLVDVHLSTQRYQFLNGAEDVRPSPALSTLVNFDPARDPAASETLLRTWEALGAGGRVLMDLREYPHSPLYGWVEDRFGVSWQLMLTDPRSEPRPMFTPSLMFPHGQATAMEALGHYAGVFGETDEPRGLTYPPEAHLPEGAVMYAEALVAGGWIVAMDAGVAVDFDFTPGVSLSARMGDQEGIDHVWEALSAVPGTEGMGWLVDRFGVSWQVEPERLDLLLARPGGWTNMMAMKKLIIADF